MLFFLLLLSFHSFFFFLAICCGFFFIKIGILQSLGYAGASLTIVKTNTESRPQLKYLKGDVCPHDSKTYLSSQIEFYCNPKAGKVCFEN